MAFTPLEQEHVRQAMEAFLKRRRPAPEIRSQLDIGYRIQDVDRDDHGCFWG